MSDDPPDHGTDGRDRAPPDDDGTATGADPVPSDEGGPDGSAADPDDGVDTERTPDDGAAVSGSVADEDLDMDSYTTETRTLDPRVQLLWVARAVVTALVVGAIATGITFFAAPDLLVVGGGGVFALALVLGIGHAILLYRTWEYRVREDSMYLDRGVVTRVQTVVPYVRVQHIDTSRGPIERAVGLSSLVVYTAGSRGADVTVPGLTPEEAADLQSRLKVLAIESEGEDAV
nr:PH domain-containing protein [Halapricum sp. CBA1109]